MSCFFFISAWHFRPRKLSCFVERSWLHWFQGGYHVRRFAGMKSFFIWYFLCFCFCLVCMFFSSLYLSWLHWFQRGHHVRRFAGNITFVFFCVRVFLYLSLYFVFVLVLLYLCLCVCSCLCLCICYCGGYIGLKVVTRCGDLQVNFLCLFMQCFFFFLSSLYLSWPGYFGLEIFATCGDSYFAFKLEFIVQNPHCFYQNILLILWCWMNVFDDLIRSNGGFECLSPNLNWRWMWRPQKYSLWMESSNCEDNIVLVNLPVIIFSVWTEFELN